MADKRSLLIDQPAPRVAHDGALGCARALAVEVGGDDGVSVPVAQAERLALDGRSVAIPVRGRLAVQVGGLERHRTRGTAQPNAAVHPVAQKVGLCEALCTCGRAGDHVRVDVIRLPDRAADDDAVAVPKVGDSDAPCIDNLSGQEVHIAIRRRRRWRGGRRR